ncbi:hypothetical protein RSSM_01527 [Rhodopirellula sallentina SM41]|uniref:Uncharacterized protein n=1 Tax=Rhodopirellula sallentina SM41 TaxID=1263870 RepID=M5ULV3_9BACT|nr:hypothetical protein RSSM_01527 [Rhodopirellula sallentina SM41]
MLNVRAPKWIPNIETACRGASQDSASGNASKGFEPDGKIISRSAFAAVCISKHGDRRR